MLYFAYGSNMSSRRLKRRTPSATPLGPAKLSEHALRFHKRSDHDGSGKCDAYYTANMGDEIHGVLYRLDLAELDALHRAEGLGSGYEMKDVLLQTSAMEEVRAFTYYATHIDETLSPLCWYKEHVLRGAEEHALPTDYIAAIKAIRHVGDEDVERIARELAVYRG